MNHRLYGRDVLVLYGAACPYVFTFDETDGRWVMDTTVLYELDGKEKETTQRRSLQRFDGRVLIREVEPEISHIDQLLIEVVDRDGTLRVLAPDHPSLNDVDGNYLVLERGDEILVTFPDYKADVPILEVRAVATGFYEPDYPRPGAEGGVATR
jgi:hypothetical protein